MGLNDQVSAERIHIGFFGLRNAGKSSLVNAVTGQNLSIVSDVLGTTTDPVKKAMELLPLGPVVIIDTPGMDDEGQLGMQRIKRTRQILNATDLAVLVTDATTELHQLEQELIALFQERQIPYVLAYNKCDLLSSIPEATAPQTIYVSAKTGFQMKELKMLLGTLGKQKTSVKPLVSDLIHPGDFVLLVTPIDSAAPKGRLILPQQQTIRELLDAGAIPVVAKETEMVQAINGLKNAPALVITDSQVFGHVSKALPNDIPLTSFSILFARYKGNLDILVKGAFALDHLANESRILISEGCTHHRQCGDIGTVKLPAWIKQHTGKDLHFSFSSGTEFPEDLSSYDLVIHCGGCMLNEQEMKSRIRQCQDQNLPMTNYGTAIAHMNGILHRALMPFSSMTDTK